MRRSSCQKRSPWQCRDDSLNITACEDKFEDQAFFLQMRFDEKAVKTVRSPVQSTSIRNLYFFLFFFS